MSEVLLTVGRAGLTSSGFGTDRVGSTGLEGNLSVRGGLALLEACGVSLGSNGADRIEPSIRQKDKVSSKVRLHVGQLFIKDSPEL
jgi:hypothetical protein